MVEKIVVPDEAGVLETRLARVTDGQGGVCVCARFNPIATRKNGNLGSLETLGYNSHYECLLRGAILNRTYDTNKKLYSSLFLPTLFWSCLLWSRVIVLSI